MEKLFKINIQRSVLNISSDFIAVTFVSEETDVKTSTFMRAENPRLFQKARAAAQCEDFERLSQLSLNILNNLDAIDARFTVNRGNVYFEGHMLNNFATDKIKELWEAGLPFDNWINFIKNTMANPHAITIEDTYRFLENHEGCPITDDGAILAYKKVRSDYLSFWKSSYDQKREDWSPGNIVELPRDQCDPDRNVACSAGLHFCSRAYSPNAFCGNGRIVMVKVFPQDIVAIPLEYGLAKARCCKAEVIRDITDSYNEFKFLSSYTKDGEAREIECCDVVSSCMDEKIFSMIENALIEYATSINASGKLEVSVSSLLDDLEHFFSQKDTYFICDGDDITHVIENSEDSQIKDLYNVKYEEDIFVVINL